MLLNNKISLLGQARKQITQRAPGKRNDPAAIGANEMMQVPRPARDIPCFRTMAMDSGDPPPARQALQRTIHRGASGRRIIRLQVRIELFGAEGYGITPNLLQHPQARLSHTLAR